MDNEQIIIGEGVVLSANPASFVTRAIALVIDVAATLALIIALVSALPYLPVSAYDFGPALNIAFIVTLLVIMPTLVETLSHGRSLGKWAMGVKVVRDDGGPVTMRQSFIRALVAVGETWMTMGIVALIISMFNPRSKRAGDLLAGTFVLRVRTKTAQAKLVMPPYLSQWAQGADMGQLPDGLALSCRQFLGRARTMHPGSREKMANNFAAQLGALVAPLPPAGTIPEDFIAAVVLERSRREQDSEQRKLVTAAALASQFERLPYGIEYPEH